GHERGAAHVQEGRPQGARVRADADAVVQERAHAAGAGRRGELPGVAEGPIMKRMLALVAVAFAVVSLQAQQVTFDRILHADKEPQNWLSYSGTPLNQRYSGLTQITPANVKNLQLQWIWQARSLEKFETTALVVNGVLYTVQAPNDVVALDAETGRP